MNKEKYVDAIFRDRIKLRNKCFILCAVGVVVLNFLPQLGYYLIGAGLSLGSYIHARVKKEKESLRYGYYREQNTISAKVMLGDNYFEIPIEGAELIEPNDQAKIFTVNLIAVPEVQTEDGAS